MISASCWVPRGYPSEFPEKYELDDAEIERIEKMANLNLNDIDMEELEQQIEAEQEQDEEEDQEQEEEQEAVETEEEDKEKTKSGPNASTLKDQIDIDNDLKEYDLEHYDDDTEGGADGQDVAMFPGLAGTDAKFHEGAEGEDPYLSLPTQQDIAEERQELQVYPTDNMILASRTEDDISYLDVYVYDDGAGFHDSDIPVEKGDEVDPDVARGMVRDSSLYVHHDLMLPAFPLCIEWIDYKPNNLSSSGDNENTNNIGNLAAIGTFDPQIEIWDLNCVEKTFPDMILGEPVENSLTSLSSGTKTKKNKNKKKSRSSEHITTHHTDAVLSLAHNKQFRSVLASTSADHTVKLWDLNESIAVRSMQQIHQNKNVSASQWHSTNGSILLTAGYDSRVALSDVRISDEREMSKYWTVLGSGEEIETASFADENLILCGTDSGNIYCFDIRNNEGSKPVWTLRAHDAGISTMSVNNFVPGMLATGAMGERQVKLWQFPTDATASQLKGPHMVLSRDFDTGNVLSTSFAPDIEVAGTMVIGGTNVGLKLWDVFTNRTVRKVFSNELKSAQQAAREEAVKLNRSSRFARKYTKNDNPDTVVTVDDQVEDDEE